MSDYRTSKGVYVINEQDVDHKRLIAFVEDAQRIAKEAQQLADNFNFIVGVKNDRVKNLLTINDELRAEIERLKGGNDGR